MISRLNNVKISNKKLLPIVKIIQKKNVKEALEILKYIPNKGAEFLYKAIKSAASNANQDFTSLVFEQILCNYDSSLPRVRFRGRGRMYRIYKRYSNIFVKLRSLVGEEGNIPVKEVKEIETKKVGIDEVHTILNETHEKETEITKDSSVKKNVKGVKSSGMKSTVARHVQNKGS